MRIISLKMCLSWWGKLIIGESLYVCTSILNHWITWNIRLGVSFHLKHIKKLLNDILNHITQILNLPICKKHQNYDQSYGFPFCVVRFWKFENKNGGNGFDDVEGEKAENGRWKKGNVFILIFLFILFFNFVNCNLTKLSSKFLFNF